MAKTHCIVMRPPRGGIGAHHRSETWGGGEGDHKNVKRNAPSLHEGLLLVTAFV